MGGTTRVIIIHTGEIHGEMDGDGIQDSIVAGATVAGVMVAFMVMVDVLAGHMEVTETRMHIMITKAATLIMVLVMEIEAQML
jgi:hypothetical protein